MNVQNILTGAITGAVGRRVLRKAKWSWIGYGVIAYVGLRVMRRFGIFQNQADRAIRMIEGNAKNVTRGMVSSR